MRLPGTLAARWTLGWLVAIAGAGSVPAQPADDAGWARVVEDDRAIKVETDRPGQGRRLLGCRRA